MDTSRELLNNLMGRDRNKPKGDGSHRDHYSNRDVCKPYLICFCFNTLFPNTIYDDYGPCNKRHDTYLKTMFDNDMDKREYEKQYIRECISWIEKRLEKVNQKIKENQAVIDNKSSLTGDRPKGILDRIIAIDVEIEDMMKKAEEFGENGQIGDSERCLEEAERLRQRRRDIETMNDTNSNAQKQQKICETCGAIQTINDTQKRIQTHLQGKIHRGFQRLRHEVQTLRVRLQILTKMDQNKREEEAKIKHEQQRIEKQETQKIRQQEPEKEGGRSRSHQKKKKQKDRERSRDKKSKKHKEGREQKDRSRNWDGRNHEQDHKHHKKKHKKSHSRDRDRKEHDKYRDYD